MKTSTIERIAIVNEAKDLQSRVFIAAYEYKKMGNRHGQALMNALRVRASELYTILSGSSQFDCFYQDERISAALQELGFNESMFRSIMESNR